MALVDTSAMLKRVMMVIFIVRVFGDQKEIWLM